MNIREAKQTDFSEWLRLRCLLYPDCTRALLRAELESIYFNRTVVGELNYAVLVAEKSPEKIVGFVEISIRNGVAEITSNRVGYVESLFVDVGFRRSGVANALVSRGEEWILRNDCEQVIVDTEQSYPAACRFYSNYGFEEILRHENTIFYKKSLR